VPMVIRAGEVLHPDCFASACGGWSRNDNHFIQATKTRGNHPASPQVSCRTEKRYTKPMSAVISRPDIQKLLQREPPLLEGYLDLENQLQPNGIDLTLGEVALLQTPGQLAASNSQRVVSVLAPLVFDGVGFIDLVSGAYLITFNEIVHLPDNVMALARPRSSLLRCGVTVDTAVWDAGYSGRSQSLLIVYNPQGFRLQRNSRIVQLVFFQLTQATAGYRGIYQNENIA